jgi:hypothetical protein
VVLAYRTKTAAAKLNPHAFITFREIRESCI